MAYKIGDAERVLRDMESAYDIKKTVKDSMDFPANQPIQLFNRFATPEHFSNESNNVDVVTRENATGNITPDIYKRVTTQGSIRSTFIFMLREEFKDDANIIKVINMIGSDITTEMTNSKSLTGWLGNLIISSRRIAEVTTGMIKDTGRKLFGR